MGNMAMVPIVLCVSIDFGEWESEPVPSPEYLPYDVECELSRAHKRMFRNRIGQIVPEALQ